MNKIEDPLFTGKFYFERIADSTTNKEVVQQTLKEKANDLFAARILKDIENPKISRSRILYCGDDPIGAIVFNSCITAEDKRLNIENALGIREIIVIGKGENDKNLVYQKLIQKAVQKAQELKAQHLYLLADHDNHEAIFLCKQNGFNEVFVKNTNNSKQLLIKNFIQNQFNITGIDETEIKNNNNLSNGFLPSTSTEICNEIALVFPKVIAKDPIPLEKQGQDHVKIVDVERIKPITQVNNLSSARDVFENRPKRKNIENNDHLQSERVKRPKQEPFKIENEFMPRQQQLSSKMHTCTLKKIYLDQILSGKKTVEGRINSGMFLRIKEGDSIKFFCGHGYYYTEVICKITKIEKFVSFDAMLQQVGYQNCLPECNSLTQAAREYSKIPNYSNKASQHGVLALHMKKME